MRTEQHRGFAILGNLDAALTQALRDRLKNMDIEVRAARHAADFQSLAAQPGVRIAVLGGCHEPATDGLNWLDGRLPPTKPPLVLVDPSDSKERAIQALRLGFRDYLAWPAPIDPTCAAVIHHVENDCAPRPMPSHGQPSILTSNPELLQRIDYAHRIAGHQCNALITGETGTGKELFAELIHSASPRGSGPLIRLNCTTLPEHLVESELFGYERGAFTGAIKSFPGRFALADHGTLFLDEIGELPLATQAKLLRALETHEATPLGGSRPRRVDLRIIAATNQPLETLVAEKRFRADLFFRLNVAIIEIPPLRQRPEDIPLLFRHFMRLNASEWRHPLPSLDPLALDALLSHDWPGNVRELRNTVESALLACQGSRLLPEHLPRRFRQTGNQPMGERARLLAALAAAGGNKSEAATRLNCSRMTLYRRMRKHGVDLRGKPGADN